jgi:glyoxylase I family protein
VLRCGRRAASCQRYACRVGRDHLWAARARRAQARVVAVLRRRGRARKRGQRVVLHHTAVVVSNLERSIAFYERHFGGRLEYVVRDNDDLRIAELLQLPEIRLSFAFIAFEYAHLELLEFSVPADGRRFDARANDFGTTHLSFQVEDVQAAYKRLAADGVELTRPPAPSLPIIFCFDPDGNRIELIQRRTD